MNRPLTQVLTILGDIARRDGRELPVIETDMATAHDLRRILMTETHPSAMLPDDHPERAFGVVAMFDGIKIRGKRR